MAGFPIGSTIYGHFRFRGRTRANYRFGTAQGPCGTLRVRAPGIPGRYVHTGTWRIQLDGALHYRADTRPAFFVETQVFMTYHRR